MIAIDITSGYSRKDAEHAGGLLLRDASFGADAERFFKADFRTSCSYSVGLIIASIEEVYEPDRCCATNPGSLRVTSTFQFLLDIPDQKGKISTTST